MDGRTDDRRIGRTDSETSELLCRWQNRGLWLDLMDPARREARTHHREDDSKEEKRANEIERVFR